MNFLSISALQPLGYNAQLLRLIKSSAEIELMKKSASIGAYAFKKVSIQGKVQICLLRLKNIHLIICFEI